MSWDLETVIRETLSLLLEQTELCGDGQTSQMASKTLGRSDHSEVPYMYDSRTVMIEVLIPGLSKGKLDRRLYTTATILK